MIGRRGSWSLILAAAVCACSPIPAERPIRIDTPQAVAYKTPLFVGTGVTLAIGHFEARGILQERNLAYINADQPIAVQQAATIDWEEPPGTATANYLATALRQAGGTVLDAGASAVPTYSLLGIVQRFELVDGGQPGSSDTGIATVALDLSLVETKTGATYLSSSYCAAVKARDQSLGSVEIAFDGALARIITDFLGDLSDRASGGTVTQASPRGSRLTPC